MAKGVKTGGRKKGVPNKQARDVREIAREYTDLAIERLAHWAKSKEPTASVKASAILLERGWGAPKQDVTVTGTIAIQILSCDIDLPANAKTG